MYLFADFQNAPLRPFCDEVRCGRCLFSNGTATAQVYASIVAERSNHRTLVQERNGENSPLGLSGFLREGSEQGMYVRGAAKRWGGSQDVAGRRAGASVLARDFASNNTLPPSKKSLCFCNFL